MRHLMRKTIMLSLLLLPAAVLAGCSQKIDEAPERKAMATPAGKEGGPVQEIAIDNFVFSPATVTIAPGTRVVWINHDDVPHTVTASDRGFGSGALDTDDQFAYQFTTPGTYTYFCAIHPMMTAEIVVQ